MVYLSPRMVQIATFVTGHKMTVGALAVWAAEGEVLLVRSKHGERRWGFPGGVTNKHEDPLEGARRELLEETGLVCAAEDLEIIGAHVQDHGRHLDTVFRVLLPKPPNATELVTDDTFEIAEIRWWAVDGLPPLRSEAERVCRLYPGLLDAR